VSSEKARKNDTLRDDPRFHDLLLIG